GNWRPVHGAAVRAGGAVRPREHARTVGVVVADGRGGTDRPVVPGPGARPCRRADTSGVQEPPLQPALASTSATPRTGAARPSRTRRRPTDGGGPLVPGVV